MMQQGTEQHSCYHRVCESLSFPNVGSTGVLRDVWKTLTGLIRFMVITHSTFWGQQRYSTHVRMATTVCLFYEDT